MSTEQNIDPNEPRIEEWGLAPGPRPSIITPDDRVYPWPVRAEVAAALAAAPRLELEIMTVPVDGNSQKTD